MGGETERGGERSGGAAGRRGPCLAPGVLKRKAQAFRRGAEGRRRNKIGKRNGGRMIRMRTNYENEEKAKRRRR